MQGAAVAVLRGGPSHEHEISLLSGHAVVANLPRDKYTVRDIYVDKQGTWHERGKPLLPADILRTTDVVISTLHGEYGENGELQRLFKQMGLPFVGPDAMSSYTAMHKVLSKQRALEVNVRTPKFEFIQQGEDVDQAVYNIIRNFHQPVVVKPVTWGSSVGVSIVGGYDQVHQAVSELLSAAGEVLVEEKIRGTEATIGLVEDFRGEILYALPTIEIAYPHQEIIPGRFSREVQDELIKTARLMHSVLGQKHYSHSDFIVSKSGVYFLELNSAVGVPLTKESIIQKSLAAVGVTFPDFLDHVITLAMN